MERATIAILMASQSFFAPLAAVCEIQALNAPDRPLKSLDEGERETVLARAVTEIFG